MISPTKKSITAIVGGGGSWFLDLGGLGFERERESEESGGGLGEWVFGFQLFFLMGFFIWICWVLFQAMTRGIVGICNVWSMGRKG